MIGVALGAYVASQFRSDLDRKFNSTPRIELENGGENQDRRPTELDFAVRRELRFLIFFSFVVGPYGGLVLLAQLQFLFWPAYLFYWGEQARIYDRRTRVLKYLFLYLLLALVTSVAANFVYSWIVNKYGR